MNIKRFYKLIKRDEGPKLDYKLKLELWSESGKKELAKDISAIANSKGGRGYLIIGVQDKTKNIIGLKDNELFKEEQIQQIITSRCEPPIPIEVEFLEVESKKVGIITIYDGQQKPYQIRETGAFYIRRGSTTDFMRKQELLNLFEDNLELTIETCPVIKSTIDLLNMDLIDKYFRKKGIYINNENRSFLLEASGITYINRISEKECCTYGGLLVFSDNNSICIPNNMIRIINKINNKFDEVIVVQGNLIHMILEAEKIIKQIIYKDYPVNAVVEAIKNAVLYREYSLVNRFIEVILNPNSIVVESPGQLIEKNKSGRNENYIKRNMWIYEKLISLDDKNIFLNNGRGLKRIQAAFRGKARIKFINSKPENSFKVILPGIK